MKAIEKAGYTGKIQIGMDVAASEFCKKGPKYDLDFKSADSKEADWVSHPKGAPTRTQICYDPGP